MKAVNCLANAIWIIFGGLLTSVCWFLLGLILCITIILIPFGRQCFKFARLTLAPFGKKVTLNFSKHPIANVLWLLIAGLEMFVCYIISAALCCLTVVGIPAGLQVFKFSVLALAPFGAKIS